MVRDETAHGFRRSRLLLWAILLGVVAGAIWAGLALIGGSATGTEARSGGSMGVGPETSTRSVGAARPALDEEAPRVIETATFALG